MVVRGAGRPAGGGEQAAPTTQPAWDWQVNPVTYKTKNFMLACAQDYRPGQPGDSEHIWQATQRGEPSSRRTSRCRLRSRGE